ncbi:MAG: hypothetical protein HY000_24035 [Planctomycetes bacterium]|nr:hypothetical protein [Planctomycetota bacterium]
MREVEEITDLNARLAVVTVSAEPTGLRAPVIALQLEARVSVIDSARDQHGPGQLTTWHAD